MASFDLHQCGPSKAILEMKRVSRGTARIGYMRHIEVPFAGFAFQCGPAFTFPGTGQLG